VTGENTNGTPAGAAEAGLVSFVARRLWAGQVVTEVVAELVERGLRATEASALVHAVEEEMRRRGAL